MSNDSESNAGQQPEQNSDQPPQNWERDLLAQIATASLSEQKLNRRWNIFFRSIYFIMFLLMLIMLLFSVMKINQSLII